LPSLMPLPPVSEFIGITESATAPVFLQTRPSTSPRGFG
jgi:hypothetical protein